MAIYDQIEIDSCCVGVWLYMWEILLPSFPAVKKLETDKGLSV